MKIIRILALGIMVLALALASGSAEAQLVLKIEDPALDGGVLEIADNGSGDTSAATGLIRALVDRNGISTIINAISSQEKTLPRLVLDLEGYQSPSDSVTISLTDTDFSLSEETLGQASVVGVQDIGNVGTFNFFGDSANQPFEPGFTIATFTTSEAEINFVQDVSVGPSDPAGSLTLTGVIEKGENVEEFLEYTYTMILQIGKTPTRDCPPGIFEETVSKMGQISDDCLIYASIIEEGNVNVRRVTNFTIVDTVVRNGNIEVDNVQGQVTIDSNRVTNGDISVKDTDTPRVNRNIVNGKITIRDNEDPTVSNNAFANADMEVRRNTGRAVVNRNVGLGTGNLEVDENATVEVTNNRTNRDITCEDNDRLIASGNEADRKLECPKPERGLFD